MLVARISTDLEVLDLLVKGNNTKKKKKSQEISLKTEAKEVQHRVLGRKEN